VVLVGVSLTGVAVVTALLVLAIAPRAGSSPGAPEVAGVQSTSQNEIEPALSAGGPTPPPIAGLDRTRLAVRVAPQPTTEAAPTEETAPGPDPAVRVRQFYAFLERGDFDQMGLLLSEHFKQTMVWDPAILRERTLPGHMDVQQADVVAIDPNRRMATVAVRVREVAGPPLPSEHVYVGTWQLVRGPTGWLLDQPDIHLE
jgi:hypothetical protein